jgi:hypothetical protein
LHFWRDTDGSEVDLIVGGTDTFKAYEVKWSKRNAAPSIRAFPNPYDVPVEVVTKDTAVDLLLVDNG